MKTQNRSKSSTRSITPKRIICQKPPFPKLIQKKPRIAKPSFLEQNKENFPLDMIIPEDSLLIKPNETLKSLYVQSPIGDIHLCLPYELAQTKPLIKKPSELVPRSLGFSMNSSENSFRISEIPSFTEDMPVSVPLKPKFEIENTPVKQEMPKKYSKLPPKLIDSSRRRETPKVNRIEISVTNSYDTPVNMSQGSTSSGSAARNNRVKLLSKNFKITRNTLTKYCNCSSLNSTPEPQDF